MDAVSAYSFSSLLWLSTQAIPLIVWPQAINGLLTIDKGIMEPASGVENYFARSLGFALLALGAVTVVLSGALPLNSMVESKKPLSFPPSHPRTQGLGCVNAQTNLFDLFVYIAPTEGISPYAAATLLITTLHHGSAAFYCWTKHNETGQTGFLLGFVGSAGLAAFGTWCLLFGGEKARISRRTGADKRTSGWPFPNAEADKRKQKKKGL
ncbi:hypothetical protein PFICI_00538 [Pestalotiopsis fici W106-1]|uniref:Uncharacterized protein n=1 Tax=Pestalotiopsis fici (strain W106-1 / CGMCC3.15140) TaxID=1229662 RepID=W3XL45_PESFW|nr:uncharacterized protein PFICI_00538 [Pestalotiopsis fici W106-1]ETS86710.1 hypothetical protein PFICI_00538 [Pestalotiopsis fici W106-1]